MTPFQLTRSVRSLNRLRQIAQVLTRHGFGHIVAQIDLSRFVPVWMLRKKAAAPALQESASGVARRLTQVCSELGPTFIKLGQVMSTRADVVPTELLRELRKLQDEVPPFDTATAMDIIVGDLSRPLDQCFAKIEPQPAASASIGQVYRARSTEGAELMVKVLRPGIDEIIKHDMQLLAWLAESLEKYMPELRVYRPVMLVDELDQTLTRELDFINEASATSRFARAFADTSTILVPQVYWELSGPRVLTLEALPGTNINTLLDGQEETGVDRRMVARRLVDCFLKQIFELGMFHADPHPGNIMVKPPATIGLIDFGQVGTITDELMTELVVMLYAAVNREVEVIVETLADMGALGRKTDRRNLCRSLQILLDKYHGLPLKRLNVGTMLSEAFDLMRRHDIVVQRDLSMLSKALGTVSAVATRLDPDLNLIELLKPRVRQAISERFSPTHVALATARMSWDVLSILRRAPGQLREALRRLSGPGWELHIRHENIDLLVRELDRSSNRLAFSVVIAAIIVGSSVVFSASTEMTILGIRLQYFGVAGYLTAGVMGLGLAWAIFRSGRLH